MRWHGFGLLIASSLGCGYVSAYQPPMDGHARAVWIGSGLVYTGPRELPECEALSGSRPASVAPVDEAEPWPEAVALAMKAGEVVEHDESKAEVLIAAAGIVLVSASAVILATAPAGNPKRNARTIDEVNRYNDDRRGWQARCELAEGEQ